jgi:stearoyl-CoA desaturase (delta-9 desaturase)
MLSSVNPVILVLVGAFTATQIAILTTTVYLHRALTHRAVTLHPALNGTLKFVTWITTGIRVRQWVAVHRKHHAHTDSVEDPHSPAQLGWFRVQLTNLWLYKRAAGDAENIRKYAKDVPQTRWDRLLFDHAIVGLAMGWAILCLVIGVVPGLIAGLVHVVMYVGLSGSVNSIGHHFGRQPYDNSATNLRWLAALTGGEGMHNNHHAAPTSARFGRRFGDLDFGWALIRTARGLGLAEVRHSDVDALARRGVPAA